MQIVTEVLVLNLDNIWLLATLWHFEGGPPATYHQQSNLHTDKSPIQPFCAQYTLLLHPNGFALILIARNGICFEGF